jgi:TatD DNase family protein
MYIDTHAHTYDEVFVNDLKEIVDRSIENKVQKVFLPNVDLDSIETMFALNMNFPNHFYPMMGLHPCYVKEDYIDVLPKMEALLKERQVDIFGIGETGLDYYWDITFKEEQKVSLLKHIEWALSFKLPLILHTRNSLRDTIDLVSSNYQKGLKGIFHCYSGTLEEAHEILQMDGFFLGIGGPITYKKSELPEIVAQLPLDRIVLETDAPYLPPVPYRGKRNETSYIPLIAHKIAEVKQVSIDEVMSVTTKNARHIFSL